MDSPLLKLKVSTECCVHVLYQFTVCQLITHCMHKGYSDYLIQCQLLLLLSLSVQNSPYLMIQVSKLVVSSLNPSKLGKNCLLYASNGFVESTNAVNLAFPVGVLNSDHILSAHAYTQPGDGHPKPCFCSALIVGRASALFICCRELQLVKLVAFVCLMILWLT